MIQLPESEIRVVQDTVIGEVVYNTMTIVPKRTIHQMRLYTEQEIVFNHMEYNGKVYAPDSTETLYKKRGSKGILSYYIAQGDSLEFKYGVAKEVTPSFTLKEFSYDLLDNPSFTVSARPKNTKPTPFVANDAVIVERTIDVSKYREVKNDSIVTGQEIIEESIE